MRKKTRNRKETRREGKK